MPMALQTSTKTWMQMFCVIHCHTSLKIPLYWHCHCHCHHLKREGIARKKRFPMRTYHMVYVECTWGQAWPIHTRGRIVDWLLTYNVHPDIAKVMKTDMSPRYGTMYLNETMRCSLEHIAWLWRKPPLQKDMLPRQQNIERNNLVHQIGFVWC